MIVITVPFHGRQTASLTFETCSFLWVDSVIVGRQFLPPSFKEVFLINGQPQLKNNLPQSCQSYGSLNLSLLSCISLSLLLTNNLQQAFWWLDKEALIKSLHGNLQQFTHSVTNMMKNAQKYTSEVRKLLHMSTKQNLDWNSDDSQTEGN